MPYFVSVIFDMFEGVWLTNSFTKSISVLYMTSIVANSGVKDIIQSIFSQE